jgi:hypothetical protein
MVEQGRKRRAAALLGTGLAVAAVAGIAIAGSAVARNRQPSHDSAVAGGPDTPSVLPTASPSANPSAQTSVAATPTQATAPRTPTVVIQSKGRKPVRPQLPTPQEPPADPVAACRSWLKDSGETRPGSKARPVARLDGAPGTVLILADSNNWVGCDTAFARNGGGRGSLRQPAKIGTPPATAHTFEVANNLIPIKDKQYDYFWAAGRLPKGITRITYAFPDDTSTDAVIKGSYWLMQHQNKVPWREGVVPTTRVKVTLSTAAGPVKSFDLTWGVQTCAQITHGC